MVVDEDTLVRRDCVRFDIEGNGLGAVRFLDTMRRADTRKYRCIRTTGQRDTELARHSRYGPPATDDQLALGAGAVKCRFGPDGSLRAARDEDDVLLLDVDPEMHRRKLVPLLDVRGHVRFDVPVAVEEPLVRVLLQKEQGS